MEDKKSKGWIFKKFGYAFKGFFTSIKEEPSLIFHLITAVITIVLGVLLKLDTIEWSIIIAMIGLIIGAELFNTAIENLVDLVSFKYNYNARKIKNVAAAAVMAMSIAAVVVGLLIFIPKIISLVQ